MAATTTRPAPDLPGRLADARTETGKIRLELNAAESDLAQALERGDYLDAESAKGRVDALRPHLALAEATENALTTALHALDAHRRDEQAAGQRQAREEAAQQALNEAVAAEHEARETSERHLAEALAGIDAVRLSLTQAKQAEQQGNAARHAAAQARADLDGTSQAQFVASPNWASAHIDRSELLTAIYRGREL